MTSPGLQQAMRHRDAVRGIARRWAVFCRVLDADDLEWIAIAAIHYSSTDWPEDEEYARNVCRRIARHACIEALRSDRGGSGSPPRPKRSPFPGIDLVGMSCADGEATGPPDVESMIDTSRAMRALPSDERDLLVAIAEGQSAAEIGRAIGRPDMYVLRRVWRARRHVAEALESGGAA